MVPGVLVLVHLVPEGDPCLLNVLAVVCWPMGDEGMKSFDVLDHHLVRWVGKFRADLVIDDILEPTLMESQVDGQGLSECQPKPGR